MKTPKELKVFLGNYIHPDFTEKDEEIYYLKREVDEKIKQLKNKEDICYKKWLKLNTENAHLKEKIKEIIKLIKKADMTTTAKDEHNKRKLINEINR